MLKYGQRTGQNSGELSCIGTFRVGLLGYEFKNQLGIVGKADKFICPGPDGITSTFSCPGDSGSLVVAPGDGLPRPAGLRFARGITDSGETLYLASPIDKVLCCLGVVIDDGSDAWKRITDRQCTCSHPGLERGIFVGKQREPDRDELGRVVDGHRERLMSISGVTGIAGGTCELRPCIRVFVRGKAKKLSRKIPSEIEGFEVRVVPRTRFEFLEDP